MTNRTKWECPDCGTVKWIPPAAPDGRLLTGHACWRKSRPERTQGQGSGYVRGMPFWTHVTTSYGRETR